MQDVSICEQRMFSLYQNHLIFFGKLMNQKQVATPICRFFGSQLDIMMSIIWYFGKKNFELSLEGNEIFSPISWTWSAMKHRSLNIVFVQFFISY